MCGRLAGQLDIFLSVRNFTIYLIIWTWPYQTMCLVTRTFCYYNTNSIYMRVFPCDYCKSATRFFFNAIEKSYLKNNNLLLLSNNTYYITIKFYYSPEKKATINGFYQEILYWRKKSVFCFLYFLWYNLFKLEVDIWFLLYCCNKTFILLLLQIGDLRSYILFLILKTISDDKY